jgi:hypothetical protein
MTVESATYIDELVPGNTANSTDPAGEIGDQVELIKTVLQNTINLSDPVTATAAELNYNDITTLGTAQASKVLTADASANVNAAALTWTDLGTVTTVAINGGTLNGTLGGTTPAAATITNLTVSGTVTGINQQVVLPGVIADVSTAETVLLVLPVSGTVVRFSAVLEGAITGADATVSLTTSADAAMASVVITQAGSAAGDVHTSESITNATVTEGGYLKLKTDGGSTGAQRVWVTVLIDT